MNALQDNAWTRGWRAIGEAAPKPRAILAISAHWYTNGTGVTIATSPRTIYDFGGFPEALYQVTYPAPGDPELAARVAALLQPVPVQQDPTWGLDHGTWSVLKHVYPAADVPVVQLSIDANQPAAFHAEIGKRLAPLRNEGVLIVGSGNVVHNLRTYAWGVTKPEPYDWAARFEADTRARVAAGALGELIGYSGLGQDARLSIPTPEHYLPLLYIVGTQQGGEKVSFPVSGIDGGSISMLAVQVG